MDELGIKTCLLYVRVSTKEQAIHGLSIEAQERNLREWCRKKGYIVGGLFKDEGVSGRKAIKKRPALAALLQAVEQGKGDLVIFTKLDRWTRNVRQYHFAQEILDKHRVSWQATQEDYETVTATGRLKVNLMLSIAENEADRTSERVKAVFEMKRAKNQICAGHVPTGYIRRNNEVFFDEPKINAIKAFFSTYLTTSSVSQARLEAQKNGVILSYKQADALLRSKICRGAYNSPAYITEEQGEIIDRMRIKTTRSVEQDRTFLFSGYIYCSECGCRMYAKSTRKDGKDFYYYFCSSEKKKVACDNHVNINEENIESYLIEQLNTKLQETVIRADELNIEIDDPTPKIEAVKRKISRLKDLYIAELISLDEYKSDLNKMLNEIEQLKKAPVKIDKEKIEELLKTPWLEVYKNSEKPIQRAFWLYIIERIEVSSNRTINFDVFL